MTNWFEIAKNLVGTPYAEAPCWEIVRRAYLEGHKVALPRYSYGRTVETIEPVLREGLSFWDKVEVPEPGDAVLLWVHSPEHPTHVGVYLGDGFLLHTREKTGALVESILTEEGQRRVSGYYRHVSARSSWTMRVQPHPFAPCPTELRFETGVTLADAVRRAGIRKEKNGRLNVWIGESRVNDEMLPYIKPHEGLMVDVESIPSDPVTLFFAIGGAVGTSAGIAAAVSIAAGVIGTAAIYAGLYFAATALAPKPEKGNDEGARGPAQSPSTTSVGNRMDPWGPVPVPYGKDLRVYPPFAVPPYTEVIGGERFWRILLCVGAGRLYIDRTGETGESGIQIGGVPIEHMAGFGTRGKTEFEIFDGAIDDLPGTILDHQPTEDPRQAAPLAYYRLGTLSDEIGGASLVAAGGATVGAPSILDFQPGGSAVLDGVDDYLELTSVSPIAALFAEDFTIVTYIKPNTLAMLATSRPAIISFGENRGVELFLNLGDWTIEAYVNGAPTGAVNLVALGPVPSLVAVVCRAGKLSVYSGSTPGQEVALSASILAPDRLTVGCATRAGARAGFFAGQVQEVTLYDVALSDDELIQLDRLAFQDSVAWQSRILRRSVYETTVNEVLEPPVHDDGFDYQGGWFTFDIAGVVDQLSSDMFCPTGVFRINDEGKKRRASVGTRWMYRIGDGDWQFVPPTARRTGGLQFLGSAGLFGFNGEHYDEMLWTLTWDVPSASGYQVRFAVVATEAPNNRAGDTNTLSFSGVQIVLAIRGTNRTATPVRTRGVAYLGLSLPVLETGPSLNEISCLVSSMLRTVSGGVLSTEKVVTDNAAWVILDKLIGSASNPRPLLPARVNLAAIEAFATRAKRYALYEDFRSNVKDSIELTGTGSWASLGFDGQWTIIEDRAGLPTSQALLSTNRNSRSLGSYIHRPELPHALRIKYTDRDKEWTERETIAYDDGFTELTATKFESIELPGVNTEAEAREYGRIRLALGRLRNNEWRREMSLDAVRVRRGSVAKLQDWISLVGQHSARVVSRTTGGGGTTVVSMVVDEAIVYETGKLYGLVWRQPDGTTRRADVTNPGASEAFLITFVTPQPIAEAPAAGDLAAFGIRNEETFEVIVREAARTGTKMELSLIPYAPTAFAAGLGPVPYNPVVADPISLVEYGLPAPPTVGPIESDEKWLIREGGELRARMRVFVSPQTGDRSNVDSAQVRYRIRGTDTWQHTELVRGVSPFSVIVSRGIVSLQEYEVQGRVVKPDGRGSRWSNTVVERVIGTSAPPPSVTAVRSDGTLISWDYPEGVVDLAGFRIRFAYGPVVADSAWHEAHRVSQLQQARTISVEAFPASQPVTVLIRAVDEAGNESERTAWLYLTERLQEKNVVATLYDSENGWGVDFTGFEIDGSALVPSQMAGDVPMFGAAGAPMFALDSAAPMFGTMYEWSFWYKEIFVPKSFLRLFSIADFTVQGHPVGIAWSAYGPEPMFGSSEEPMFGIGGVRPLFPGSGPMFGEAAEPMFHDEPMWPEPLWTPYRWWPGQSLEAAAQTYSFRINIPQSPTQQRIERFRLLLDVDDLVERLQNVVVGAMGSRLPISKVFSSIDFISLTVEFDGGTGVEARIVDRSTQGPLVEILDSAGNRVAGILDAEVRGAPVLL